MLLERRSPPDPSSIAGASPVLRTLSAEAAAAVAAAMHHVGLQPGDSLFPDDDRIDALHLLESGALHATEIATNGATLLVRTIAPGELVDHLQVFSGGARPVQVRAAEPSTLWTIPGDVVDSLVESTPEFRLVRERIHRRQLFCRLHAIFGTLDETLLDDLERAVTWRHLRRGELVFDQGERADSLYFVVSGRVQAIRVDARGTQTRLGEATRGDTVGEGDFFTGETRSARVMAVRDSVVVGLTTGDFDALVARRPQVLRHVTRNIVERQRRPIVTSRAASRVATIAVLGMSDRVSADAFTTRLTSHLSAFGPVARLSSARVDSLMAEPAIAQVTEDSAASERLLAWLEGLEARHRFVVLETDPADTEWTQRCLRLADRILLVAHAKDDPQPRALERALLLPEGRITDAYELLILVHDDGSALPVGTRAWLAERPHVEEHHHLRWTEDGDFGRLARVLAGRAVGMVLGGGGARGLAHIGVLEAVRDGGIPIDMIGGTSMGAAIAAQWALGWNAKEIAEINHRVWIQIRPHRKLTIPIVSVVGSRLAQQCGRMMYGEAEIEDLWIPFFCVSSNLTTAEMMVHRRGSLLRAATASASLPGFAVPALEGNHLLCDGGLLNNLPTDVMRQFGAGTVIASEVSLEEDASFIADRVPTPWEVLRRRARFPTLMEVVLRASLLHSTHREQIALAEADLTLRPPVEGFSMMDFPRLAELVALGREYARGAIRDWRTRELSVPSGDVTRERRAASPQAPPVTATV
jgi:NTE family protein/lysophospholipid hydrolase